MRSEMSATVYSRRVGDLEHEQSHAVSCDSMNNCLQSSSGTTCSIFYMIF